MSQLNGDVVDGEKFVEFEFISGEVVRVHFLPDGGMVAEYKDSLIQWIEFTAEGAAQWKEALA